MNLSSGIKQHILFNKNMRVIKIFIAILAVMLIGCRPIDIPKEPLKPDIEDTEDGDTEKPEDGDTEEPGNGENPEEGETPGDNEEPQETYYVKVAQTMSDWSGDYIITYTSGNQAMRGGHRTPF